MAGSLLVTFLFFILMSLTTLLQVKNQREPLLAHPLVTFLLNYKWKTFGRYIYYFKLSLYCLFLFFLTGYTVYSTENAAVCVNGTSASPDTVDEDSAPYVLWIKVGRIVILALASWHILSEVRRSWPWVLDRGFDPGWVQRFEWVAVHRKGSDKTLSGVGAGCNLP